MDITASPRRAAWLGALLALLLLPGVLAQVQRGRSALASTTTAETTGCEEESFYAVWRVNHGLSLYPDSSQPPYAAAYFNWLFYRTYSAFTAGGPDDMIPHRGRLFTLLGGAVVLALGAWVFVLGPAQAHPGLARLGALALFSCGIFGWWLFTLRPDVWALAGEIGAVLWFLTLYPRRRWLATAGTVALAYVAWSFKQVNVAALTTVVLVLLARRDRAAALVAVLAFTAAILVTLAIGGPEYRAGITAAATGLDLTGGASQLGAILIRALPQSLLPAYGLGIWLGDHHRPWTNSVPLPVQLATIGLIVAGVLAVAANCKIGAAHNYYFTAAFFAVLLGVQGRAVLRNLRARNLADRLAVLGCVGACLLGCLQLSGRLGKLSLDSANAELAARRRVWESLPAPRFSSDLRLMLPWLNPGQDVLFPAFNYDSDRARHRPFAHDGIGGMIRHGSFAALLLPTTTGDKFDGAQLTERYRAGSMVEGMTTYTLRPPNPPPRSP